MAGRGWNIGAALSILARQADVDDARCKPARRLQAEHRGGVDAGLRGPSGHSPEGAALVQLCSFLGPDPIPYALLWEFRRAADLPPELQSMLRDEFSFYRAVREAGRRALAEG